MDYIKETEWRDLEAFIDGVKVTKITGLKYKSSQEKEHLHAAGDEPLGIQSANRTYEGEISLLKGEVDALNRAAKAAGLRDLLDLSFVVVAHYRERGNRIVQVDTLRGVEVTEYEKGMEQNAKSMPITLPILFTKLISS